MLSAGQRGENVLQEMGRAGNAGLGSAAAASAAAGICSTFHTLQAAPPAAAILQPLHAREHPEPGAAAAGDALLSQDSPCVLQLQPDVGAAARCGCCSLQTPATHSGVVLLIGSFWNQQGISRETALWFFWRVFEQWFEPRRLSLSVYIYIFKQYCVSIF